MRDQAVENKNARNTSRPDRVFAIGDIHGCAAELEDLLRLMDPKENDLVVFLGDYIDRGPDSRRVIDIILALGAKCEVVALRGNHEQMLLDFIESRSAEATENFLANGGRATLESYRNDNDEVIIPGAHIRFFKSLRHCHAVEDWLFVHAGVPDLPLELLSVERHGQDMLWIRNSFLRSQYNWGKTIVHGHTTCSAPEVKSNRINVDTGCVYGGSLTAIELRSGCFFRAQNLLAKSVDERRTRNHPTLSF